jgi:hypothetical protein
MLGAASGSAFDPFRLARTDAHPLGLYNLDGRTWVPTLSASSKVVIVAFGQSLIGNNSGSGYSIVNSLNHNFCLQNGAVYQSLPRLLGAADSFAQDNFLARLADKIITGGAKQRVILAPFGADGSVIADWAVGGGLNHWIAAMARSIVAAGLASDAIITCSIGESDALAGTSQSAFQNALTSALSTFAANGLSVTSYIEKCTWIAGSQPAGATAIRAAIDAAVNGTTIKAGADSDTLNNSNRQDTTHWNATGADAVASLWKTALGL